MSDRNILISGAGIAGTASAYWLRRHGLNPTVVERAPTLRADGYKVDIRGAAVEVAERMGILDEVRGASTEIRRTSFVNGAGKQLATMDAELFGGRSGTDVEIMRGDLNRILYDRTRDEVEYIFDESITAITPIADGVRVSFEHGRDRTFDLVVGADGLHSNVRALTFGDESAFIEDLGYYVSIFSTPNHLNLDRCEIAHPRPGKTALLYSTRLAASAKAMFFFESPPLTYDHRDIDQQKRLLAEAFAGEGWEVPRLLASMATAPDFYFDPLSQVRMDHWSTGRAVLVGDAAYCASPASGQGTSLGLVGAYVLAGELADAADHPCDAFRRYELEMRDFVEENQKLAASNIKGMVMRNRWQIRLQLLALRLLPHIPGSSRVMARVTDAIHNAATAITLKNYRVLNVTTTTSTPPSPAS